eukprot:1101845-Pyramimonas_sp.AAC.1
MCARPLPPSLDRQVVQSLGASGASVKTNKLYRAFRDQAFDEVAAHCRPSSHDPECFSVDDVTVPFKAIVSVFGATPTLSI